MFNCVVLRVDRHSGYILAVPGREEGLLARELAVMMVRHCLTVFGLPRFILQRPLTSVHWWLVQGYVFPHETAACQECRLPQPVQWPS